jgi:hypothetical protein
MNLYQLTEQQLALKQKLEEMNLDEQTIEDTLEGELGDIEHKVESIIFVRNEFLSRAEARAKEGQRLLELADSDNKKAEKLDDYVKDCLNKLDIKHLPTKFFEVSVRINPPKIEIIGDVPEKFYVQPKAPRPVVSKTLIDDAMNNGEDCSEFAERVRGTKLVIK